MYFQCMPTLVRQSVGYAQLEIWICVLRILLKIFVNIMLLMDVVILFFLLRFSIYILLPIKILLFSEPVTFDGILGSINFVL